MMKFCSRAFKVSVEVETPYCPVASFKLSRLCGLMFSTVCLQGIAVGKGHLGLNMIV
jgi:hypothetical protein